MGVTHMNNKGTIYIYMYNRFTVEECSAELTEELCESRGGRPGLPVLNKPTVTSVDVKQHFNQRVLSSVQAKLKPQALSK